MARSGAAVGNGRERGGERCGPGARCGPAPAPERAFRLPRALSPAPLCVLQRRQAESAQSRARGRHLRARGPPAAEARRRYSQRGAPAALHPASRADRICTRPTHLLLTWFRIHREERVRSPSKEEGLRFLVWQFAHSQPLASTVHASGLELT